jgi:hypothetical protein
MDDEVNPFWAAPQEAAAELRLVVRYVVLSVFSGARSLTHLAATT